MSRRLTRAWNLKGNLAHRNAQLHRLVQENKMPENETCRYNLTELPSWSHPIRLENDMLDKPTDGTMAWSGTADPPPIGAHVAINFNGLGSGTVTSYFTEHGWLGVIVKLDNPPDWHRRQSRGQRFEGHALVFGAELY